jgi:hypothetical protein
MKVSAIFAFLAVVAFSANAQTKTALHWAKSGQGEVSHEAERLAMVECVETGSVAQALRSSG